VLPEKTSAIRPSLDQSKSTKLLFGIGLISFSTLPSRRYIIVFQLWEFQTTNRWLSGAQAKTVNAKPIPHVRMIGGKIGGNGGPSSG
jgi:hypothetical protein